MSSITFDRMAGQAVFSDTIRRDMSIGLAIVFVLVGGLGAWAATTSLAGAVVGSGTVVVDTNVKKVQHPTGGIVGEIRVKDGDMVRNGDVLVRLDETVTRANLMVITNQLDELGMRQARLAAERDAASALAIPPEFKSRLGEANIAQIVAGERMLFESRRTARTGQKSQLRERIAQLNEEIAGLKAQGASKIDEIGLIRKELNDLAPLEAKNLVPASKMTQMRREATRIEGERAQVTATLAQAKGKIAETELQIIQIDQDMRSEVMKDLRESQGKVAELTERKVAAEDQLKRVEIRAPQNGIVHQMSVHTVGGVISPTEPVMLIVPEGDALVVEAKIAPQDIDHVKTGQTAFVRFPAFNQRTTPEIQGTVSRISADTSKDGGMVPGQPQAAAPFYVARITLDETEKSKAGKLRLLPGMPAEVHFQTSERTALSYLVKPLQDQIAKAFNEQ
jgi:HlyD family secretion protein